MVAQSSGLVNMDFSNEGITEARARHRRSSGHGGREERNGVCFSQEHGPPKADNKVRVQVYECEGSPPMPEMV